jgi:hypothetical protein
MGEKEERKLWIPAFGQILPIMCAHRLAEHPRGIMKKNITIHAGLVGLAGKPPRTRFHGRQDVASVQNDVLEFFPTLLWRRHKIISLVEVIQQTLRYFSRSPGMSFY